MYFRVRLFTSYIHMNEKNSINFSLASESPSLYIMLRPTYFKIYIFVCSGDIYHIKLRNLIYILESISSLSLVCIHLSLFIDFLYVGGFISPTHVTHVT